LTGVCFPLKFVDEPARFRERAAVAFAGELGGFEHVALCGEGGDLLFHLPGVGTGGRKVVALQALGEDGEVPPKQPDGRGERGGDEGGVAVPFEAQKAFGGKAHGEVRAHSPAAPDPGRTGGGDAGAERCEVDGAGHDLEEDGGARRGPC